MVRLNIQKLEKMNFFSKSIILNTKISLFLFVQIILCNSACKKLDFERVMDATTDTVYINGTSVTVQGTITDLGSTEIVKHGHCWSTNNKPSINDFSTNLGSRIIPGVFSSKLNNLIPGVKHYVRSYLFDGVEYTYGEVESFVITDEDIQFVTSNLQKLSETSVKVSSSTNGIGSVYFNNHGHCWSQIDPPTNNDSITAYGPFESDANFESTVNNLALGRYYIRGYLVTGDIVIYSNTLIFESIISIKTDAISINTDNTAIASGTIKSLGVKQIINYGHCYSSITSSPDLNDLSEHSSLGPTNQLGGFSSELSGLVSGRVYFVRAYATDGIKAYYGEIKNFMAN